MDLLPHQIIGGILLGRRREVMESNAPWVCVQCMTCSMRCPNGIDVARVMDGMRRLAVREGAAGGRPEWTFDKRFLDSVQSHGRLYELGAVLGYKADSRSLLAGAGMGLAMLRRGRLGLLPQRIRDRRGFRAMLRRLEESRSRIEPPPSSPTGEERKG